MERSDSASPHITDAELAQYLDRALPPDRRAELEHHLADCSRCRAELLSANRVVRGRRVRSIRRIGVPVAAAAAAAVVLLVGPWTGGPEDPVLRDRGAGATAMPAFSAVSPTDGEQLAGQAITFVWSSLQGEARYRFTISNAEGDEVWAASSTDTTISLPNEIILSRGVTYFWYVDALLLDGRSVATGVRGFRLAR